MAPAHSAFLRIGDIVKLPGQTTRLRIRELLPDGRHAVCEQSGSRSGYASYILALKDLLRCGPEEAA
jgi:hypothetical protein